MATSKKDFEAVARAVDAARGFESVHTAVSSIAFQLADYFSNSNPRFDRQRFLKACGVKSVIDEVRS